MKQLTIELSEKVIGEILEYSRSLFTTPAKLISAILSDYLLEDSTEIAEILAKRDEKLKGINEIVKNMGISGKEKR